ncbi:MAG TPA: BTAD domain-containing putative transcriptional regulator [Micromonosporaceae bacterium]|nr:BTAD domain-containing putative transcriptional regulator [Micromonosporaceae bacterium]
MEFHLLGPVEIRVDGHHRSAGPPKQRAVLAALLVDARTPVLVDTLIDRVWGDGPPAVVRNALYSHVARIRHLLANARSITGMRVGVERRSGGYVLDVDRDRIDLFRWRRLIEGGRDACRTTEERASDLRKALALWHSAPLAGIDGAWADQLRESLLQQRLAVLVTWSRLAIDLRQYEPVIEEVGSAVADNPLVEPLIALHMQALTLAGRGAEALNQYAVARRRFADDLGTEPGPELRATHAAILRGEFHRVQTGRSAVPSA